MHFLGNSIIIYQLTIIKCMKKLIPVLLILVLIGIGGYFYLNSKNFSPKTIMNQAEKTAQSGNVFTSIKDALSKSISLTCSYKDEQGKPTTVYIKAGSVRSTFDNATDKTQPNNVILTGGKMYLWNDSTKAGFMYTMKAPAQTSPFPTTAKITASPTEEASSADKSQSFLAAIEKFKNACKPGAVDASLFVPPTDVKFQDMDAILNEMKKVPTQGASSGNYQQYIQQMLQKQGGQ